MKHESYYRGAALSVLCSALFFQAAGATLIPLTNATSAAASTAYANRDPKYAVNGAGLYDGRHTNTADLVAWMTQSGTTVSGSWFRVDLGQVTPLSHFKLWNFNFWHISAGTTNRGIREAEVYLSSLATTPGSDFTDTAQWTRVIDQVTFAKAPGANTYTGEPEVSLSGLQGRWLALRVLSNFNVPTDPVGISELQVFAAEKPVIVALTPTVVTPTQVILPGTLTFNGGFDTTVYAFWGATDGGTVSSAWDHVVCLGQQPLGTVSTSITVNADADYVFRFQGVSASGEGWSAPSAFITAPVTVSLPARVSEGGGPIPVSFSRPASLTNGTITVNFGISGDVTAGADYPPQALSAVIPAGASTAQVSVVLTDDETPEPDETLTLGLAPGACTLSPAGTNSTLIVDDDGLLDTRDWQHHMKVTLSGYSGPSTLTNFPCALRLSEQLPGFLYADFAKADGGDLRVTDTQTGETLRYEIESWNPAGTSVVWVTAARLAGADTAFLLHWGNADAALPGYASGGLAWAHGFGGVWHLGQPNALDSTANRNHGTAFGNVTAPGLLGNAQYFDGNDYVRVPDHASLGADVTNRLTVSLWLKPDQTLPKTNEVWRMLEKGDDYFMVQGYGSAGGAVLLLKKNNGVSAAGNGEDLASNTWHHVCGTYDGSTLRLYVNGLQKGAASLAAPIDDDQLPLRIGSDDADRFFLGVLDETRVESAARSADWVKACYDSQREGSTFGVFGTAYQTTLRGTLINVH